MASSEGEPPGPSLATSLAKPIKSVFQEDCRRFALPAPTFEALQSTLRTCYGPGLPNPCCIKFHDDEGELCTITSTAELLEAFKIVDEMGSRVLKVFISAAEKSNAAAKEIAKEIATEAKQTTVLAMTSMTQTQQPNKAAVGTEEEKTRSAKELTKAAEKAQKKAQKAAAKELRRKEKEAAQAEKEAARAEKQAAKARKEVEKEASKANIGAKQASTASELSAAEASSSSSSSNNNNSRASAQQQCVLDWVLELLQDLSFQSRLPTLLKQAISLIPSSDTVQVLVRQLVATAGLTGHAIIAKLLPHLEKIPERIQESYLQLKHDPYAMQRLANVVPTVSAMAPMLLPAVAQWLQLLRDGHQDACFPFAMPMNMGMGMGCGAGEQPPQQQQQQQQQQQLPPFDAFPPFPPSPPFHHGPPPPFHPHHPPFPPPFHLHEQPGAPFPSTFNPWATPPPQTSNPRTDAIENTHTAAAAANPWAGLNTNNPPASGAGAQSTGQPVNSSFNPWAGLNTSSSATTTAAAVAGGVGAAAASGTSGGNTAAQSGGPAQASEAIPQDLHPHVTCDGCGQCPLRGIRYKCAVCPDYDLCSSCNSRRNFYHQKEHAFVQLRAHPGPPTHYMMHMQGPPWARRRPHHHGHHGRGGGGYRGRWRNKDWRGGAVGEDGDDAEEEAATVPTGAGAAGADRAYKPKARFLRELSLPDRAVVLPNQTLIKTWELRNTGRSAWPQGTKLIFIRGHRQISSEEEFDVPPAAAGETVEVSAVINTPDISHSDPKDLPADPSGVAGERNRFTAVFRLADQDRVPFGPRLWCDLVLTSAGGPAVSAAGGPAQSVTTAARNGPAGAGAGGLLPMDGRRGQEQKDKSTAAQAGSAGSGSAAAAAASAQDSKDKPAQAVSDEAGKYEIPLQSLHNMGFQNRELNLQLLQANDGNVQKVCDFLLKALYS